MAKYLITFDAHAMEHIAQDELPSVAEAAHAVCQAMIDAGVLVFAGGVDARTALIVAADGATQSEPPPGAGGLTIIDVPTRDEALAWAARIAAACRCPQDVRLIMDDPELEAMLRRSTP